MATGGLSDSNLLRPTKQILSCNKNHRHGWMTEGRACNDKLAHDNFRQMNESVKQPHIQKKRFVGECFPLPVVAVDDDDCPYRILSKMSRRLIL